MSTSRNRKAPVGRTRRGGRNVLTIAALRQDLVACSDAQARFLIHFDQSVADQTAPPATWQHLREALIDALCDQERHYLARLNSGQLTEDVLSPQLTRYLAEALMTVSTGEPHPLFTPIETRQGRGNRQPRLLNADILKAADYLTAVDLGLLTDGTPHKTVANHYGVSIRQVRRWHRGEGDLEVRRSRMERRYKNLALGSMPGLNPRVIERLMEIGGDRYRRLSRKKNLRQLD